MKVRSYDRVSRSAQVKTSADVHSLRRHKKYGRRVPYRAQWKNHLFRHDERPRQASSEGTRAKYNADASGSYQIPQYRSRASQADASASCRHLSPFLIKCCEKTGQVTSALDQATSATLHKPPSCLPSDVYLLACLLQHFLIPACSLLRRLL